MTFPAPGPYKVLVDIYPTESGVVPNFQLSQRVEVGGPYRPQPLQPYNANVTIDGYHVDLRAHAQLHAIQAEFMHAEVTDAAGHPVTFTPWFGALAHAIFFREGSLDYFHTHICAPTTPNCGSLPGVRASAVSGTSTLPGNMTIGVMLTTPGTWRLFLQMKLGGKVVTAPFTLKVTS